MITHHASRSCEQRIRGKYIAFHKGAPLSDYIIDYVINAATRGLMTATGERLLLIPDTRHGPPDVFGLRIIRKFRKADCTTLKQLIRKIGKIGTIPLKAKKAKNGLQNVKQINALKTRKMQKTRSDTTLPDCDFLHKEQRLDEKLREAS